MRRRITTFDLNAKVLALHLSNLRVYRFLRVYRLVFQVILHYVSSQFQACIALV